MNDEKTKNLDLAISQIEKQHGKGSIMRLGNRDVLVPVNVIPTGSIALDGERLDDCDADLFVPSDQRPIGVVFQNYRQRGAPRVAAAYAVNDQRNTRKDDDAEHHQAMHVGRERGKATRQRTVDVVERVRAHG